MAWAQFISQGVQTAGQVYDVYDNSANAGQSKEAGYATSAANEDRIRRANAIALGRQRAAAAQSGFDPSSGSMAKLQSQSAGQAELEALTERYKGDLNAWQQDEIRNKEAEKFKYMIDPLFGGVVDKIFGRAAPLVSASAAVSYYGSRSIRGGPSTTKQNPTTHRLIPGS